MTAADPLEARMVESCKTQPDRLRREVVFLVSLALSET
jgi:hypothetical protein